MAKKQTTEFNVEVSCEECATKFFAIKRLVDNGGGRYCSRQCSGRAKRGKRFGEQGDGPSTVKGRIAEQQRQKREAARAVEAAEVEAHLRRKEEARNYLGKGVSKSKYDFYKRKYPGHDPQFDAKGNFVIPKHVKLHVLRAYAGNVI